MASADEAAQSSPLSLRARFEAWLLGVLGYVVLAACTVYAICLATWSAADASLFHSSSEPAKNLLGPIGAILADLVVHLCGLTGIVLILPPMFWALQLITLGKLDRARTKIIAAPAAILLVAAAAAAIPKGATWPLSYGYGGLLGDQVLRLFGGLLAMLKPERAAAVAGLVCLGVGLVLLSKSLGLTRRDLKVVFRQASGRRIKRALQRLDLFAHSSDSKPGAHRREPTLHMPGMRMAARPARAMEPSFASQLHSHAPAADHFPYAQRGPASQPDLSVDETSDIARRFAPARREGEVPKSDVNASDQPLHAWPDHRAGADDFRSTDDDHGGDAFPPRREASPHGQLEWPPSTRPRHHEPALEELYGRAVAIVLRDRKVSSDHLRGCMKIGYMCASDIIERMEKEGVVGAPLYNGLRPILIGGSGSGEI